MDPYTKVKYGFAVLATIGLYTVLYRENKFYRVFEHIFLGLAAGWAIVALWTESLYDQLWIKMIGTAAEPGVEASPGYWAYILLLPIGFMGYFVFSKRHNWMSRIPIGIILGLWSGQQVQVWWNRYGPQIANSVKPLWPTTTERWTQPSVEGLAPADAGPLLTPVYPTEALSNLIFVITLLSVISYFLFSFDIKNKALRNTTVLGRWLLLVGFGAIFGSTVMMRFSLLIDRMYFIFIEFLKNGIFNSP